MGIFADSIRSLAPETKAQAVGSMVPTWQAGVPQYPVNTHAYERLVRQGYLADEIVYAAVEAVARTASMARFSAFRTSGKLAEQLDSHPALALLDHPNKFLSSFNLWANTVTHLQVAGNAYWEKVRSASGKVVELWLLRPDRIRIIPHAKNYIAGYEYRLGSMSYTLDAKDVVHFRTRHLLDDYYGLPPLAILTGRADLSVWSREFALSFFRNSGVPSGLLNIMRQVNEQERELIRQRFRQNYGGPQGWHNMLVLDNGEATYTQMGLPLDKLMAKDLDESNEARICAALGVPPSVVGTRIGMSSSSYANRKSDVENWWESTLSPMYGDMASQYFLGITDDFPDLDHFEADTSNVPALAQDEDALHNRVRSDFTAGLLTREEARLILDYPEEPVAPGFYLIAATMIETPSDRTVEDLHDELDAAAEAAAAPPPAPVLPDGTPAATPALPAPADDKKPADGKPAPAAAADAKKPAAKPAAGKKTIGGYEYASTQINLTDDLVKLLAAWRDENLDPDDLAEGGEEDEPHITVKYGLLPSVTLKQLRTALAGESPVGLQFGLTSTFAAGDSGVPLYVAVVSPELNWLHILLTTAVPNVEAFGAYVPHVTLAYIKPSAIAKYIGVKTPLFGMYVWMEDLTFSNTNGDKSIIHLSSYSDSTIGMPSAW